MTVKSLGYQWPVDGGDIELMYRHSDVREAVYMDNNVERVANATYDSLPESEWYTGVNLV